MKSTIIFVVLACIIIIILTYKWSKTIFDFYPVLIIVTSFLSFSLGIKTKKDFIHKIYYTPFIIFSTSIYGILPAIAFWLFYLLNIEEMMFKSLAVLSLFWLYTFYYIFGVILLAISRIQIRKIAYSSSILRTIWILMESLFIFIFVLIISINLSNYIMLAHNMIHYGEKNFLNLTFHKIIIFLHC